MKEFFESADEALDFAIQNEQESFEFYTDMAEKMERPGMSNIFKDFARQEMGHKAKLEAVKEGRLLLSADKHVQDLKIADYLVESPISPKLDYQDALVLAMKKEKAAFRLYTNLAEAASDENLKQTFQALAEEEAKHKLRVEMEYDDHILTDN
jgi:rubrerythrin